MIRQPGTPRTFRWTRRLLAAAILLGSTTACGSREKPPAAPAADQPAPGSPSPTGAAAATGPDRKGRAAPIAAAPGPLRFREQELSFRYERGASERFLPVETTGGGVGLLDFDGDGDLDLFFAQGRAATPRPDDARAGSDVLLRNDGSGRFVDVSREVGLGPKGHGQGVAVADFDGDGDPDVLVTRYGVNTLWRNDRDRGRFTDVTAEAGLGGSHWSLGAAFADLDGDGDLDLFIANYFRFDPAQAPYWRDPVTGQPDYGMPEQFPGEPDLLYRNDGGGHFSDVTARAGVAGESRGMGCLAADFDEDGRIDLLVANDAQPNALWHNRGDGTFEEVAMAWGLGVNGQGHAEANMGIAHGDTNGDGTRDVVISHFFNEHDTLWRRLPRGVGGGVTFVDQTFEAGLGIDSRPFTGWGTILADFDQDGYLDLVVTNGHIRHEPSGKYRHENPPILWQGQASGRFRNISAGAGTYFDSLHLGRGLAAGDLDGDGDLDLVVVHHDGPSVVLWNESPAQGHGLILDLRGSGANPEAIGARIRAAAGGRPLVRSVDGGGSYLSASDRRVHLGLGAAKVIDRLEIRWPSGKFDTLENVPCEGRTTRILRESAAPAADR